jgi:uncharacterized protein YkwD
VTPALRRLAAVPLAATALALPHAAPAGAACAHAAAAVICIINGERAAAGVLPVRTDRSLAAMARAHSARMVAIHRFTHGRFAVRIGHTAWARRRTSWQAGETLAWGLGERSSPGAIVAAWMQSPQHRAILLDPRYRVVGVGAAAGIPVLGVDGRDGRTYTADFGT